MAKIHTGRRAPASPSKSGIASVSASEALVTSAVVELAAPNLHSNGSDVDIHAGRRESAYAGAPADQIFVREAILVLGMHRSGTSALTGTLVRLGATVPATPMAADQGNERGYYEFMPFMVLHDQLLASAGSRWDDWRRFDPAWLSSFEAEKFRAEARKLLLDEFGDAKLFVLKDPRACRFIPFWKSVLAEARTALQVVIPLRSPIEVARSLRSRDGMPLTKGLLIWLRHALEAERETRDVPRAIVVMEKFLGDWRGELNRISGEIGLAWPRSTEEAAPEIDAFLSIDLVHQHAAENELPALHSWALSAYTALCTLAHQPGARHARAMLDEIASAFETSCGLFGTLLNETTSDIEALRGAEASARQEVDAARQELDAARGSMEGERSQAAEHRSALEAMLSESRAVAEAAAARLSEVAAGAEAEIGRLQAELESERRRIAGDEARLALLERFRAEQAQGLVEVRGQLVRERDRADTAARDLANRTATIEALDAALRDERALRSSLEARNSALVESTVRLEARLRGLGRELDQRDEDLAEAKEEVARVARRLSQSSAAPTRQTPARRFCLRRWREPKLNVRRFRPACSIARSALQRATPSFSNCVTHLLTRPMPFSSVVLNSTTYMSRCR